MPHRLARVVARGLRFTQGHHLEHWIEGRKTKLNNLVLLCRFH